jgi:hypothetical protein
MKLIDVINHRVETEKEYVDPIIHVNTDTVNVDKYGYTGIEDYIFADKGLYQFCNWLKIPFAFFMKLSPEAKQQVMCEMVEKLDNRKLMFRVEQGHVRGVVSDKYRIVNHSEVLQRIQTVLGPDMEVAQPLFYNGLMDVRLCTGSEDLQAGVSVQNSEIGERSMTISPFIYRLVCSNGLIVAKKEAMFRQVHSGTREYSLEDAMHDALKEAEISRHMFELTKQHKIDEDNLTNEFRRVARLIGLPKRIVPYVEAVYSDDPSGDGFGIMNAFTRYAQVTNLDERIKIESAVSKLLTVYSNN